MLKKPGRNATRQTSSRNATTRACEAVAYASRPPRSFGIDVGAARAFMSSPCETGADTSPRRCATESAKLRLTCWTGFRLVDPNHDAVGDAARIHDGQPGKTRPF